MKHLTRKLTIGLLATTLCLSAKDPALSYSILDMEGSMLKESVLPEPMNQNSADTLTDSKLWIARLTPEKATFAKALFSDSHAKQELKALKKVYKQLVAEFSKLSDETKKLKLEQAQLKAENDAFKEEKKSTWERLKNWFFKLDTTKVLSSFVSGAFTLAAALIAILL